MQNKIAGWEGLNDRQTNALLQQRSDIEAAETGIITNAHSLLGTETTNHVKGLITSQSLTAFKDQDRWKSINTNSAGSSLSAAASIAAQDDQIFINASSWEGIRSRLDAEAQCEINNTRPTKIKTPTASRLEYQEMRTYGGSPALDEIVVVTCSGCNKPLIPSAFKEHRATCRPKPVEEIPDIPQSVKLESVDSKVDISASAPQPKLKKRKEAPVVIEDPGTPIEESPAPEKKPTSEKKQKVPKQPKAKAIGRTKGPLDLDKQCGVIVIPGGTPCTRSLTCKSHSMSSKRSVVGRSKPYDVLLGFYQKKVMPAKVEANRPSSEAPQVEKEDVNVDSDEEYSSLLDAVRSFEPQPLAVRPMTYMHRRNHCHKIRDLLCDALKGPHRPMMTSSSSADPSL